VLDQGGSQRGDEGDAVLFFNAEEVAVFLVAHGRQS